MSAQTSGVGATSLKSWIRHWIPLTCLVKTFYNGGDQISFFFWRGVEDVLSWLPPIEHPGSAAASKGKIKCWKLSKIPRKLEICNSKIYQKMGLRIIIFCQTILINALMIGLSHIGR